MTDLHARDAKRYPVSVLCGLLGVSKQAYYKRDENAELAKAAQEEFALQYIRQVRAKDHGVARKETSDRDNPWRVNRYQE